MQARWPRLLGAIDNIEIRCSDCGRTKRWTREHVASRSLPANATLDDLGKKLVCSACREQGGRGFNVEIYHIRH